MTSVTHETLEHVAMDAGIYPTELIPGCESALILFAAAFDGRNDAIHFAEAGVPDVTLVDIDVDRLEQMRDLYRDDRWRWILGDAWAYADAARSDGRQWDGVSVDTFSGADEFRSLAELELWTSLARRFVTVTYTGRTAYLVPRGWNTRLLRRSPIASWLILERPGP